MHDIVFYRDNNGKEPVKEYIQSLFYKDNKDSRVKREKIQDYLNILAEYGTRAGEPFVKHLDGDIWELRPLKDRILFFSYINGKMVLLSHFRKSTRKTPQKEINKAKKLMYDFIKRSENNE